MTVSFQNLNPIRIQPGPLTGEKLNAWWGLNLRELFAPSDLRNPSAVVVPGNRTASVQTIIGHIDETGRAANERFLYPVTAANRDSVQSIDAILSATSNASTSQIAIAAHSVTFDFGSVAYSSGSITGLTVSTVYYVYANDPTYAGGAVSYVATTNATNLIGSGYYYVGSVTTPVSSTSFSVTAATLVNPTVITTASAHGWTTGDTVQFATMTGGFVAVNGLSYSITVTGASTLTIPVDATAFAPYAGGGTASRVSTAGTGGGGGGGGGSNGRWHP